ncbi:hypothetical protein [Streptomyces sp. NBC_00338]|uniref:hypothetical protein n=1 Tax=Streptomyces sp. NBC_00338 TaxID=2975715 RepID=UPI00224D884C|nr:hypothetical protein [Streptomyces sp. NBC_00338]MCX5144632.1 hypothetical protein [Streptomyces sp. NBC_00338]MCX5145072.1 hypothetical protein [Streptomyces sp. NBC_00338]
MPEPSDPMTVLAAAAAQVHELYQSYVDAGFTEQQALELTKAVLIAGVGGAS